MKRATRKATLEESLEFATAIRTDPHIWKILLDNRHVDVLNEGDDAVLSRFEEAYVKLHFQDRVVGLVRAISLIRQLLFRGEDVSPETIESTAFRESLRAELKSYPIG